jgi:hypothetical protein
MISPAEAFGLLRAALEMAGARFAVGGSWASTAFGVPRFTNDVDILVAFTARNLDLFLSALDASFYVDDAEARSAFRLGRPFNVIYMPTALKFDLFPAHAFPLGMRELDRALQLSGTILSEPAAPFVTPEDILIAKLHWYQVGGEVSEVQWRDIDGLVRNRAATLDRNYLEQCATELGLLPLLRKALAGS